MAHDQELQRKRGLVGLLGLIGLIVGAALLLSGGNEGLASAFIRVGLLLGAFWLALPTDSRPAAWARVSPWSIAVVAGVAVLLPRLRFFLPVLVVGIIIGWVVRPRRKKPPQ